MQQQAQIDPFERLEEPAPKARRIEVVKKGRHYEIPSTKELVPSVTNILNATPKPALVRWAANKERELVIEAAANLYEDAPIDKKMSRAGYTATLTDRIGKQRAYQKELDKAGEIGSLVHERTEWQLRKELLHKVGPELVLQDKALWAFMAWEDWRKTMNLTPIWIEQTVWSSTYKYAGTLDLYATFDVTDTMIKALPKEQAKKIKDYVGTTQFLVADWKTGKAIYGEAILQNAAYKHALVEMGHAEKGAWGAIVRLPKMESDPDFEVRLISPTEHAFAMETFLHIQKVWEWTNS